MALKKIKMNSSGENGPAAAPTETPSVSSPVNAPPSSEAIEDVVNQLKMRVRKVASPLSGEPSAPPAPETAVPAPPPVQPDAPPAAVASAEPGPVEGKPESGGHIAERTTHLVRESANSKLSPVASAKFALKKETPVPAAPEPAATQPKSDSKLAAKPRDSGGLAVKKNKLEMPPEMSTPPTSIQMKKPKKSGGPSSASAGFAIVLVLAANAMLTIIPLIKLFMASGKFPGSQMIISIFFPLVVIIMIGSMKKPMLVIAGILIGLNALAAVALVAARPAIGQLPIPGLNEMLPPVHQAAGAILLLLGGILLLAGHHAAQWAVALILTVLGIAMPWVPLETMLPPSLFAAAKTVESDTPPETEATDLTSATSATSDFTIKLPDNWKMLSAPGPAPQNGTAAIARPSYTFSLVDGSLTLLATPEIVADTVTLENYAAAKLAAFKGEAPDASGMVMDVPERTERKRLFIIVNDDAIDMLIVAKTNLMYVLFCRGSREIVQTHRPELDKIFQSFLLN